MPFTKTPIDGLLIFEPTVLKDERGYFFEAFNQHTFAEANGHFPFVQDNQAFSQKHVLRALHYQVAPHEQGKLVRVLQGEILDVAVDIRPHSPTYGQWFSVRLSAENKKQLFVPRGFAHGYAVLSETAEVLYKCDNFYAKSHEGGIAFDDPFLQIDWEMDVEEAILSERDRTWPRFGQHRTE